MVENQSTVILINGPSAAGKSTLQKTIQRTFNEVYLTAGIDQFFDELLPDIDPDESGNSSYDQISGELIRKIVYGKDSSGAQTIALEVGPAGQRVVKGMHRAFAAYAASGNNIVIDYILYDPIWRADIIKVLSPFRVYMVGVTLPIEVLEHREYSRGTSPVGHARSHYYEVHEQMLYDITVDTSVLLPEDAALVVKNYIKNNPDPLALKTLLSEL